jgi:hypothetical protein
MGVERPATPDNGSTRRKPTWSATEAGVRLDYWRYRWNAMFEAEQLRRRSHSFTAWVGDHKVAEAQLDEWSNSPGMSISLLEFVRIADRESNAMFDLANVIFSSFCRIETKVGLCPFDYGSVVSFERLRIERVTARQSKAVWMLVHKVLSGIRRGADGVAGIVLKAFPLEYENTVTDENRDAFERRRQALMRLYRRQLGMATLPGWPGKDGWQWLSVNCPLEPLASRQEPRL